MQFSPKFALSLMVLTVLSFASGSARAQYSYTDIADPNAINGISAFSINNQGQIVGSYTDQNNTSHGFLDAGGNFSIIDDPAAVHFSSAHGINNNGQIVGDYQDVNYTRLAYLFSGGTFTEIGSPGLNLISARGLNDQGQIVGFTEFSGLNTTSGFLDTDGTLTFVDAPGAVKGTQLSGINNQDQMVGFYYDANNNAHSFLDTNGLFTAITDPNSVNGTYVRGINNKGQVVGNYYDANFISHGFLETSGIFSDINVPDGLGNGFNGPVKSTSAVGINDLGQIVGNYFDTSGPIHAFLATPAPVPEASTMASLALLLALGGLVIAAKRKRSSVSL